MTLPRHRDLPELLRRCEVALDRWLGLPKEHPARHEVDAEWVDSVQSFVYQHNRMEGVGLDAAATRTVLGEYFTAPLRRTERRGIDEALRAEPERLCAYLAGMDRLGLMPDVEHLHLRMEGRSLRYLEVAAHAAALKRMESAIGEQQNSSIFRLLGAILLDRTEDSGRADAVLAGLGLQPAEVEPAERRRIGDRLAKAPPIPLAGLIQDLHRRLFEAQPYEPGQWPGTWRTIPVESGEPGRAHLYPAPESLAEAMERMAEEFEPQLLPAFDVPHVARTQDLTPNRLPGRGGGIEVAARLSHRFVAIHPFADGNGRISRLLLGFVLRIAGLPFLPVLRGDNASKRTYIRALQRADVRGDFSAYEHLIASAVLEAWQAIDRRLALIGEDPFDPA